MKTAGLLTRLSLAWSRDGEKKFYVQDRMREVGRELWSWLAEGAHVYVCGPRGMIKAVVDTESKEILGAAALGLEGGEIMAMFEIAMMGKVPYSALRNGIFAHPTLAELMNNLFASLDDGS